MKYALALISLVLLWLYISTAPPVMYFGDDGEVISAAHSLGIGHPPGYPLYMLYTKAVSMLPAGETAFRANLGAGLLAVMVFLLFYLCGKSALGLIFREENIYTSLASLGSAVTYAVSSVYWFEAIHSKGAIYLIMNVFVLLTLYFGMKYHLTKKIKFFYAAFFAAGFLIPAHNTSALFLLFSAGLLVYSGRRELKLPGLVKAFFLFLFALATPYAYLFIRMKAGPLVNWGNLETYREVIGHILRETYNYNTGNISSGQALAARFADYFRVFVGNYWLLAAAAAAGAYFIFKRSAALFAASAAFFVFNLSALIYVINTSGGFMINDLSPLTLYTSRNFYLTNDILPVLCGAAGLYGLIRYFTRKTGVSAVFLYCMAGLMPLIMIFANYEFNDKSSEFLAYDHADNILKSIPEGSILFTGNDCPLFNIVYLKDCMGKYTGIRAYDTGGCLLDYSLYRSMKRKWDREEFRRIEETTAGQNPGIVYETAETDYRTLGETTIPYGIIYRAGKPGTENYGTSKVFGLYSMRGVIGKVNPDIFYRSIAASYPAVMASYEAENGDREKAVKYLGLAAALGKGSPGVYMNIALVYNLGLKDPQAAVPYIETVLENNPFDYSAMDIMVKTLMGFDAEEALRRMKIYYPRLASAGARERAAEKIAALEKDIAAARLSERQKK